MPNSAQNGTITTELWDNSLYGSYIQTPAPAAVTGLAVGNSIEGQLDLTWTNPATNEDGSRVERSPDGSTGWAVITTLPANATSYSNTGLGNSATWHYRITNFNGTADAPPSSVVSKTTLSGSTALFHNIVFGDYGYSNGVFYGRNDLPASDSDIKVHGACYYLNGNPPANYSSHEIVTDATGDTSDQVLRVVKDAVWEKPLDGCESAGVGKTRAEIRMGHGIPTIKQIEHGSSVWYSGKILFPSTSVDSRSTFETWKDYTSNRLTIGQFIGGGNGAMPELQILVGGGVIQYVNNYSVTTPGQTIQSREGNLISIESDKWYYFVYFWTRSWESDGVIRGWYTDDPIGSPLVESSPTVEILGPVAVRSKPTGYITFGLYQGAKTADEPFHIADFDNYTASEGTATFNDVLPY